MAAKATGTVKWFNVTKGGKLARGGGGVGPLSVLF